jgi:hypothetical protein
MKQVDGRVVALSAADIAQQAADAGGTALPRRMVPLGVLASRIVSSGRLAALAAVLDANPAARTRLMRLEEGIYADDAQARALLTAAGFDADEVLR